MFGSLSGNQLGPEGAKALPPAITANGGLTSLDISNNRIGSSYVKPHELTGSALEQGAKVMYQGRGVSILREEDDDGDIMITNVAVLALADALRVNDGLTKME